MDGFEIHDPRFAHYILDNAPLETLADGFRWIEGLVWMGDAGCLLFQDLPRNRTMRWIESAGVSVYRKPSHYSNGQSRDRQGRLISCSHLERCLFRTELDGSVTRLVHRHDGKRLNAPNDVNRQIRRHDLVHRSSLRNPKRLRRHKAGFGAAAGALSLRSRKRRYQDRRRRFRRPERARVFVR